MATVRLYSLKKDGDKYLSKNFKVSEFRCKDGSDKILICQDTVDILQAVRNYFGKPVTINSAYRSPTWNKKVGGATGSQHVKGTACDIKVANVPSSAVAAYLEANYPKHGIGYYSTFVHIDSRGYKSYWKDTGSNVRNTFGLGTIYTKYKAKQVATTTSTIQNKKEEEVVTYEQFKKFMDQYNAEVEKKSGSSWFKADTEWAKSKGLFNGNTRGEYMWESPVTREQLAAILHRLNM